MPALSRFLIKKLHGSRDLDISLDDNTLILVGENGTGKTTLLRLLSSSLAGQWSSLAAYDFESITLHIGKDIYEINSPDITKYFARADRRLLRGLPSIARRRFLSLRELPPHLALRELERLCLRYNLPFPDLMEEFVSATTSPPLPFPGPTSRPYEALGATVLYLPTYRRIEHDLDTILAGLDDRDLSERRRSAHRASRQGDSHFIELVEFGMSDVVDAIDAIRTDLDKFAREHLNNLTFGYLDDIIEQKDKSVKLEQILAASPDTIESILARIQEPILSSSNKARLREIINAVKDGEKPAVRSKLICHYFAKLMAFHRDLETRESQLTRFCEACNRYLTDKEFRYNTANFSFTITRTEPNGSPRAIQLEKLSSGEKQLVSVFCQLYLSKHATYFVLIDEPELSLSVPWQRKFLLDIRSGDFCSGLVAATHSPFIYDNSLSKYARGLGEF